MRPSALNNFSTGVLSLLAAVSLPGANPPAEGPWATETVRGSFHPSRGQGAGAAVDPFRPDYTPPADPPRLPGAMESDSKWEESIMECTRWNTEALEDMGFSLPPGTLFLWDSYTSTLAVHTRSSALPEIRRRARRSLGSALDAISIRGTVMEGSKATLLPFVEESYTLTDHGDLSTRLHALMAEGKVQSAGEFRLETRSGKRAKADSGAWSRDTISGQQTAGTVAQVATEEHRSGLSLELHPVTGAKAGQVEMTFVLSHTNKPPTRRQEVLAGAGGIDLALPVVDHHETRVPCSTTLASGVPRILAAWTPQYEGRPADLDQVRLLLVEANLQPVLPPETPQLKERLAKLADPLKNRLAKPGASPAKKSVPDALPPGMEHRLIKVTPGFLTAHVQEQLQKADIPMPEGSACVFHAQSSSLKVVNTPENLDAIQALVSSPQFQGRPVIRHTLHILHGDGPTLRKWTKEMTHAADPSSKWKELMTLASTRPEQVKVLDVARVEGQSEHPISPPNPHPNPLLQGPAASAPSQPEPWTRLRLENRSRQVGLYFEVNSIQDPEGRIAECDIALEYHYAPPTFVPAEGPQRQEQFHRAKLTTALVMRSGVPEVIGEWTPLNLPGASGKDVLQIAVLRLDTLWIPESEG